MEKIDTFRFGEQEFNPETVLHFPLGLPGFEGLTRFQLFHKEQEGNAVFWLQSVEDAEVSLPVIDPAVLNYFFELHISDEEEALLQVKGPEEIVIMLGFSPRVVGAGEVTVAGDGVNYHVSAPILINVNTGIGMQKVLPQGGYSLTLRNF